ncbi:CatB-related O-acetyltransferase [Pelagovum pacificum]|uniref:CatB-related O-acetyltransferase n=1 Tax=Pelagovum pacificum TaxID=2588711 RepID=A0A5C5GGI5_9RHOB|nr:CatB-related O-acetyltransferase [Pelagovum pacificum]QQA43054.1 CatB-related O-acetyltransferase [Pelagovum pacificum]TNY33803.1 CatB-related O-acetyltransferase [Pelagovum pacificum]
MNRLASMFSGRGRLFTDEDRAGFFALDDIAQVRAGTIRGPFKDWTVSGKVLCGGYTSINGVLNARGDVTFGRYCAFGRYNSFISGNHRTDMPNQQIWLSQRFGFEVPAESKGPIEIGHNVWVGDKVNVLSGVQVGHGAVLAAGATVTKDVEPFTIVGGNPAKPIRKRFTDKTIAQLLKIAWWDWDDERISRNKDFFETSIPHDRNVDLLSIVKA